MFIKLEKEKGLRPNYWSLILSFIVIFTVSFLNFATAADYPTKPIQIIVAFPPGGGSDVAARTISNKLSAVLGQPVVVINKPGAGGLLGAQTVKSAPPDGYSILVISGPFLQAPLLIKNAGYSPLEDFIPVNLSVITPNAIVVKKDAPWATLRELIADSKKNPGKLTCGNAAFGSGGHFASLIFKQETGADVIIVPLEGGGPLVNAALGGHIDLSTPEFGLVHKHVEAGSLRTLAIMHDKHLKNFPDIPTTVEIGFPNAIKGSWQGFVVRSGTPQGIVEKLDEAFKKVLKDKEIINNFEKTQFIVENRGLNEARKYLADEQQRCLAVMKAANIVPK
jgi:tripartite-type tricarboxylate transporter receptor subunit TctC